MATAYLSFIHAGVRSETRNDAIVPHGWTARSETVATSASSAAGSLTASKDQVVKVSCASAVYAMTGESPTASATNGVYIPAGVPEYLAIREGESVALIDA